MDSTLLIILIVSALGPVVGSLIGVLHKPSKRFMFNMLAFAAGVMIAVSFLELIPESIALGSVFVCIAGIVIGAFIMLGLDIAIPHIHPGLCSQEQGKNLKKTALYLIAGIFMHNLPEGIAIATGVVGDIKTSLIIAIAIAVQNVPEGICTSAPYYYCTKNRLKSFLLSASTAIPILVGFGMAYFLFQNIPDMIIGLLIGGTAGVMIYISADELIPTSCNKDVEGWDHSSIMSLILGVVFVVVLGAI